ncbi:NUDIX domain-containing protein [Patescibacteria group bacterium]|nr:NUDIX domain-containing protein [Patescibacteria group bacterium]
MKQEHSAGGMILRKKKTWEVLVIRDMNDSWTFPKGLIEPGEKARDAAIREIREETGLTQIRYCRDLGSIDYQYRRNGLIRKTVAYFLFSLTGAEPFKLQREEGIRAARWVTLGRAVGVVGYPDTNLPLLEKAAAYVNRNQEST